MMPKSPDKWFQMPGVCAVAQRRRVGGEWGAFLGTPSNAVGHAHSTSAAPLVPPPPPHPSERRPWGTIQYWTSDRCAAQTPRGAETGRVRVLRDNAVVALRDKGGAPQVNV